MTFDNNGIDLNKLQAWMTVNDIDRAGLARILNISVRRVNKIFEGGGYLRPDRSRVLIDKSLGQLAWADLYPFIKYQPKTAA
jgi:hypothetical protein